MLSVVQVPKGNGGAAAMPAFKFASGALPLSGVPCSLERGLYLHRAFGEDAAVRAQRPARGGAGRGDVEMPSDRGRGVKVLFRTLHQRGSCVGKMLSYFHGFCCCPRTVNGCFYMVVARIAMVAVLSPPSPPTAFRMNCVAHGYDYVVPYRF